MKNFVLVACIANVFNLLAQNSDAEKKLNLDEVVILGTRYPEDLMKSGKMIYKRDSLELNLVPVFFLAEQLSAIPGLFILGSQSAPGTNIGYYSRGLGSEYSMVMIDGVPLTDPSLPSPFFDIRLLNGLEVKGIEVLQSGLGSLYGSGASGSVLNLTTRKVRPDGFHGDLSFSGGSFRSINSVFDLNYAEEKFNTSLVVNYHFSRGFSAARDTQSQGFDKDGFEKKGVKWTYEFKLNDRLHIHGGFEYTGFENQYDLGGFTDSDEIENSEMNRAFLLSFTELGSWHLKTIHSFNLSVREYDGTFGYSQFKGRELYNEIMIQNDASKIKWLAGIQSRLPGMEDNSLNLNWGNTRVANTDIYANGHYNYNMLDIHAGLRQNLNEAYGNHVVYHFNPSLSNQWEQLDLSIFTQLNSSFLAPSPSQLYSPWGSIDLNPEKGMTFELGSIAKTGNIILQYSYFKRVIDNKIVYVTNPDFTGQLENLEGRRSYHGHEASIQYKSKNLSLRLSYSNMENLNFDDYDTQGFIPVTLRQPSSIFQVYGRQLIDKHYYIQSRLYMVSQRKDMNWATYSRVNLKPYSLWNIGGGYITGKWNFGVSLRNILNTDYMEIYGYNTAGFNWLIQIGMNF